MFDQLQRASNQKLSELNRLLAIKLSQVAITNSKAEIVTDKKKLLISSKHVVNLSPQQYLRLQVSLCLLLFEF